MGCPYKTECKLHLSDICNEQCPVSIIYNGILSVSKIPKKYLCNTKSELLGALLHNYVNNLEKALLQNTGLYLYSKTTGTGKTFSASIIAHEFVKLFAKKGLRETISTQSPVFFSRFSDFHNIYIQQFRDEGASALYYRYKNNMIKSNVLIIDDIGIRTTLTDALSQELYEIINTRYETKRLLIITSNVPRMELKRTVGDRVYSRLCEMTTECKIKGEDRRENR
jgi:DNA replication protein DnaC